MVEQFGQAVIEELSAAQNPRAITTVWGNPAWSRDAESNSGFSAASYSLETERLKLRPSITTWLKAKHGGPN